MGGIPKGVRPTSSRVREAICSIVLQKLQNGRVLDGFGGAGTMSLEFKSRGASFVCTCEKNSSAAEAIAKSFQSFENGEGLELKRTDILRFLGTPPGSSDEQFDLVLFDPPYKSDLGIRALELLVEYDWLREGAVVILEADSRKEAPTFPSNLAFRARRRYGDTSLYIFDYCT